LVRKKKRRGGFSLKQSRRAGGGGGRPIRYGLWKRKMRANVFNFKELTIGEPKLSAVSAKRGGGGGGWGEAVTRVMLVRNSYI